MSQPVAGADPPRPGLASKDDVPRAVEFLIHFLMRCLCFGLAAAFGLVTLVGWACGWPGWVVVPATISMLATFALGVAIRPRGRFHFDRHGPGIIVPASPSPDRKP